MEAENLIKTIGKRVGQVLLGVFVFVWVVVALINTIPVQSFLASQAAKFFSEQWNTKVSIGALSVTPFINAGVKDIYVEDLNKDTLLYASYVEANLFSIPKGKHIVVRNVELDNAVCHLVIEKGKFNFQFIIDYFASDKPKEKKKSEPLVLEVKDIRLNDVDFVLANKDSETQVKKGLFASNLIVCNDINMRAKNFKMKGVDIQTEIEQLSVRERCGIALNDFKGEVKVSDKGIELHKGIVKTDDSFLDLDATMATTSFHTYSSFVDSVYCTVKINEGSFVDMKEACYWNERISGAKQKVYLACEVAGTISDMNIKAMDVRVSQTNINATGRITGLTDINNTVFDININEIVSSVKDFKSLNAGTLIPDIKLPDMVARLGTVEVLGEFKGKINDFATKLLISTDLGSVDLIAKAEPAKANLTKYVADINSKRLNVGAFLDNTLLGNTTLNAQAELVGTNPETMQGVLTADLRNCYFKGNNYNEIKVRGGIEGYDVSAKASIDDELVQFSGNCGVNYKDKPTISLQADIANMDLHKMNIISFADTTTTITTKINANVDNLDLEHLNCSLELQATEVKTKGSDYKIANINLVTINQDNTNKINLTSDIIDADIFGKFTLNSLTNDINHLLTNYIPDFSTVVSDVNEKKSKDDKPNKDDKQSKTDNANYKAQSDVDFAVSVKDVDIICSLFDLDLDLPKAMDIDGKVKQDTLFVCNVNAPKILYSNMDIDGSKINVATRKGILELSVDMDKFGLSDSLAFKDVRLFSEIDSTNVNLLARVVKSDDSLTNANIELRSTIDENGFQGNFHNTFLNLQGTRINFNNNHIIGIANKNVSVLNLMISSATSKIVIDGKVSDKEALTCNFENVDLSVINPFIASSGMTLKGILNRNVVLRNVISSPTFTSNLVVDDLEVNDVYLGKAWLNVDNNISPDVFNANIKILHKTEGNDIIPLQVVGLVAPTKEEQLDLKVSMNDFSLVVIKSFVSSFASELEGSLSCKDLSVKGKMTSPDIWGTIHCNNAALKVNMLNTKYWLNDDIVINNNKIVFKDFALKDVQGNKITVNGDIAHQNFQSFDLNLRVVADKIKILDTKAGNGEMYYGTAYASANVDIATQNDMINITGNARTEPGTSLTVPVTSKESAMENDFITFVNPLQTLDSTSDVKVKTQETKSIGYNIDLDLNVNPNAKLYIPMDFTQLKGDLAAAGNGDLKITMNSEGRFSMIGSVAIADGTFGFNIMDVMEKKFILQQGGTLTWNGDPAKGVLDVSAIYKTKASLTSVLGNGYNKPVDVESIIRLTGEMTNPKPSFDIVLPNTDEQTVEQLFMYIDKSNEKVMLEQTASLLLTNQFYPSQGGYETGALSTGVTSSVMGVAFSQLSGMVSNMIKIVDVDLNYTVGGTGENAVADQLDATLSKSYGKWTVEVNTSFGGGTSSTSAATTNDGSQIIGDVSLTYKYNENLNFEVFNHSNANDFTKYNMSPYTQGAKITYKREYDRVGDILKPKKNKKNKTKK